jgi:hypothetical protein
LRRLGEFAEEVLAGEPVAVAGGGVEVPDSSDVDKAGSPVLCEGGDAVVAQAFVDRCARRLLKRMWPWCRLYMEAAVRVGGVSAANEVQPRYRWWWSGPGGCLGVCREGRGRRRRVGRSGCEP